MPTEPKKRSLVWGLVLVASILVVVIAVILLSIIGIRPDDEVTNGYWQMTEEWSIQEDSQTLHVKTRGNSIAWHTQHDLAEVWKISADMKVTSGKYARMVFGKKGNVVMAFSLEYKGSKQVKLYADILRSSGWKNVYTTEQWISLPSSNPVNLQVSRNGGLDTLNFVLSQNGEQILKDATEKITPRVFDSVKTVGLAAYDSKVTFGDFSVMARGNVEDLLVEEPVGDISAALNIFTITVDEHVESEDWITDKSTIHNLQDGNSVLTIDNPEEGQAWNMSTLLGEQWTISVDVTFGESERSNVSSRFAFSPNAGVGTALKGLFTLNFDKQNKVRLQLQSREGGSWQYIGDDSGWVSGSGNRYTVQMIRYKNINRVAVLIMDGSAVLISQFTDELSEQMLDSFRYFGLMVYSSQVQYSNIKFENTADESKKPVIREREHKYVSELTLGAKESTDTWQLGNSAIFFHENEKEAIAMNYKGEDYSYPMDKKIDDQWTIKSRVEFGEYYADVAACRIALTDENMIKLGLMTIRVSPGNSKLMMTMQAWSNNDWLTVSELSWFEAETAFDLEMTGNASGVITIRLLSIKDGKVLLETSCNLPENLAKQIRYFGLGTLNGQVKYSMIDIQG